MSIAWIDISVPLHNGMATWPGDEPFDREQMMTIASGDVCNLSRLHTSAHAGTHMDAPRHFLPDGAGIDTLPLDVVIGPARVLAVSDADAVGRAQLEPFNIQKGERVLLRTRNSRQPWADEQFREKFVAIAADGAHYLAERGVALVGVDYLSVGGYNAPDNPEVHQTILRSGAWIIEGLTLVDVQPGDYELICLPLKIVGSDGGPARAILRKR
jgi:arylformamidase